MLKFSKATEQAKLKRVAEWLGYKPRIYSFSLPSGWTCPFAEACMSKADRVTGKITDGKKTTFRCFAASDEARHKNVRAQRWHNFDILRNLDIETMVDEISMALPADADLVRTHVGGDFFNNRYFVAWMLVAKMFPRVTFYAYTKSIPYWVANLDLVPDNFILNGSRGGRADSMLDEYELKVAEVVFSLEEAEAKGLEIDHDERHALQDTGSFGLLIHGTQPKGSDAGAAIKNLKAAGVEFSYGR